MYSRNVYVVIETHGYIQNTVVHMCCDTSDFCKGVAVQCLVWLTNFLPVKQNFGSLATDGIQYVCWARDLKVQIVLFRA